MVATRAINVSLLNPLTPAIALEMFTKGFET